MTIKQITERQERDAIKFEVAKKIRELLDAAKKQYGADDWDGDAMDEEISSLVFEDA